MYKFVWYNKGFPRGHLHKYEAVKRGRASQRFYLRLPNTPAKSSGGLYPSWSAPLSLLRLSLSAPIFAPFLPFPTFAHVRRKVGRRKAASKLVQITVRWSLVLLDVSRKKKREIQNFFLPSSSFEFVPEISESWKNFLDVQAFRWSLFKEISFNRGISSHFNMKF